MRGQTPLFSPLETKFMLEFLYVDFFCSRSYQILTISASMCRVLIQRRSKVHMVIEKVQSEINSNATCKRFGLMFSFFMHDNIRHGTNVGVQRLIISL